MKKAEKYALYISGALTAVICAVMNFILIPKIENSANGIKCFDMNFAYTYETAKEFLSLISSEGRSLYLNVQLPLDFIYPIAYGVFFFLLISFFSKKKNALIALPVLLAVSDYCENICTVFMLKSAELSPSLARFASGVTCVKTVLMYVTIFTILTLGIIKIKNRKKQH